MLTKEGLAGRASDELHELMDRVDVSYDHDAKNLILDMQGDLILEHRKAMPAKEAGIDQATSSLDLVAGGRFVRSLPDSSNDQGKYEFSPLFNAYDLTGVRA